MIEIVLLRRSPSGVAPDALVFEAKLPETDGAGLYDPAYHDLHYRWTFDDPSRFEAPQNLVDPHRDANVAFGPMVAHVYRRPGRYKVKLVVTDPRDDSERHAETEIEIGDANARFFGRQTLFVSPAGDWQHAPDGAVLLRDMNEACALVQGQARAPRRIMLNRGESYEFNGLALWMNPEQEWPDCQIVAGPGRAERPRVRCRGSIFWSGKRAGAMADALGLVFQNIAFEGPYDSRSPEGEPPDFISTFSHPPSLLLFDGCHLSGFNHMLFEVDETGSDARVSVIHDTVFENYRAWAISASSHQALALLGSRLMSHPQALVDSTPNMGAPVRCNDRSRRVIVQGCDFYSRQGWSPHGPIVATQPCIRFNSSGYEGARINCQTSSFEGGVTIISLQVQGGSIGHGGNALIEHCYLMGSYQTADMIGAHMGGLTLRNCVMVMPDAARIKGTNNPFAFLVAHNRDKDRVNATLPLAFYNNTLVNLCAEANMTGANPDPMREMSISGFDTVHVANNVLHQPMLRAPVVPDAPLHIAPMLRPPREIGYQTSQVPLRRDTATPPESAALFAPLDGSEALGDALREPVAHDDFFGKPRPPYPSRGALERP